MTTLRTSREPVPHTCAKLDEIQRLLDEVRAANDSLRAWGNEEADARDRAERRLRFVVFSYERMKHQDRFLSEESASGSLGWQIAGELWRAIKSAASEEQK